MPPTTQLAPDLRLRAPDKPNPLPKDRGEDEPEDSNHEPPRGKLVLYWD